MPLGVIHKMLLLNLHLLNQLRNQSILLPHECNQKMLLLDLLISIFIGKLLAIVNGFH